MEITVHRQKIIFYDEQQTQSSFIEKSYLTHWIINCLLYILQPILQSCIIQYFLFEFIIYFVQGMEKDKDPENQSEENQYLRYKALLLFKTNVSVPLLPIHIIQIIAEIISYLQVLKFSVDYQTVAWVGYELPIFSYLDLSYYVNLTTSEGYTIILVISIIYMALFCLVQVIIYLLGVSYSTLAANIRKIIFIVTKNVLFLPFLNIILKQFGCRSSSTFITCFKSPGTILVALSAGLFLIFSVFVAVQSFLNFQFLTAKKQYVRLKKSSYTPLVFLAYVIINELNYLFLTSPVNLVVVDISTIVLIVFVLIKDEQLNQQIKLLEIAFIAVNLLALLILDIQFLSGKTLGILLFVFLSVFMFVGIIQLKTWSIKFELQNINKWPTSDIMIRYANNLSYFLARSDQYLFLVFIHGYMQIHRQKCDSLECPTRRPLSQNEKKLFDTGQIKPEHEQLLRVNNIIKVIFNSGYMLTPVSPELQLENSIFLYENKEKELALRNLLMIKYQKLSFDKYYRYHTLKEKVKGQINQQLNKKFLDLVSEMEIKRQEQEIIKKFEKAAMINLQFWSCLNEDHPDFHKMNEIAASRIQIHQQVKRSYQLICSIAHSEKITVIFANYLDAIQNDEQMFNDIYAKIKKQYALDQRIILQDWNNTSNQIMIVSIEESSYGKIVDLNSSCGTLFGYQKFQLVNQPIKLIFIDAFKELIKQFLSPSNNEKNYYLTHKSGYLLKVSAKAQYYNSMSTGMTAIVSINLNLTPYSGFFIIDSSQKIVGVSASILPLTGLDSKVFEGEVSTDNFFQFDINEAIDKAELKQQYFSLLQLIKPDFIVQEIEKESRRFKFCCIQTETFKLLELSTLHLHDKPKPKIDTAQKPKFQFQIEATINAFKYLGKYGNEMSHISQFNELNSKQQQNKLHQKPDYGLEISTLRLYQNKIQIIEQQDEDINELEKQQSQSNAQIQFIHKKDEQEIFQSKQSYQKFIQNYKMGYFLYIILLCNIVGLIAIYITYFVIFTAHNNNIQTMTSQVAYQNLIIGSVTKQLSLMSSLDLIPINKYPDNASRFVSIYTDNMKYLQSIQLMGWPSFPIVLDLQNINQTFMTNQFLLTFINYANTVIANSSTTSSLSALFTNQNAVDPYIINYLTVNSAITKQVMISQAIVSLNEVGSTISTYQTNQSLMISFGFVFVLAFVVAMMLVFHSINKERISIFQIFLDLSDNQIQQYSSKTEKFLFSLHVEENDGQLDIQDEIENRKKINSSSFAKRKRFKSISFNKELYIKLPLISLFFLAYFIQSFAQSNSNLSFQLKSYNYFFLISKADYQFFTGLAEIQQNLLINKSISTSISNQFRGYYQQFLTAHYDTFGQVQNYHNFFMNIFFDDICHGVNSSYGLSQIIESCQLPLLYPNGSFLVFTDTLVKTEEFDKTTFNYSYLVAYQVLSKVHRTITQNLMTAQQQLTSIVSSNLVNCLLIWIIVSTIIAFCYGLLIVKKFIEQINQIKYILTILPISVARELPLAKRYLNKMIKSQSIC